MDNFTNFNKNIFRLTIPFKDVFTTVYLIKTSEGAMLFDAASTNDDVENYIIPFLNELNISVDMLKYVFISHNHRDHSGGLNKLIQEFPNACIISCSLELKELYKYCNFVLPEDNQMFFDVLKVITIPGHTYDSCGILDTRTNTLITGDCLQFYGIYGSGNWACNITLIDEHMEALDKIRTLNIDNVLMAHNYHPCGFMLSGNDNINSSLDLCIEPLLFIRDIIIRNPDLNDEEIQSIYNNFENIPTVKTAVITALRKAISDGSFI